MIIDVQKKDLLKSFTYPGGETQVRLTEEGFLKVAAETDSINVVSRITSAQDIVETVLTLSAVALHGENDPMIRLVLPYLPYARADRRFVNGDCFGLRAFISMFRGSTFDYALTLDAHSDVGLDITGWLQSVQPDRFIQKAVERFVKAAECDDIIVLYPDEGARKRYESVQMPEEFEVEIMNCTKNRDAVTGKLLGFTVPILSPGDRRPILIVDDICDGGGTFLGIADLLPKDSSKALYVTHGIFSQGFGELAKRFEGIYTTDSYPFYGKSWLELGPLVEVFDCMEAFDIVK